MKGKSLILLTLSLVLVLGLGGGIGGLWAKEPEAPGEGPLLGSPVGTAFTYQGRLLKDGNPVTDTCDFKFTLWDSLSNPTGQVGSTQEMLNVTVSDGLFTVQLNGGGEFSADAFTGDARWLMIGVRCPAGIGSYIPLTPRQELTATPYALSLRPGAKVEGATADVAEAILTVKNTGMGVGVEVEGASYGIRSSGYFGVYGDGSLGILGTSGSAGGYGVYGQSTSSTGGWGVYGLANGSGAAYGVYGRADSTNPAGVTFGVYGRSDTGAGTGVEGYASATSGPTRGVVGQVFSPDGYGVYGINNGGGVAIYAGGSGIIKSVAETRVAINPFEMEATSKLAANQYLDFTHHWLGYTIIKNTSGSGGRNIYVPAHNLTQLFGSSFKLKSLEVCYDLTSASSYIDATYVYYANMSGGRTELLSNTTNRTSISWTCYTVSTGSPLVIDGPILVYFELNFAGTGDTHAINIGRMIATLVE